jgi:hypothetical protein
MSSPVRASRVALLYAAVAVWMTWPLAMRMASMMPAGGDNVYVAWSLAWVAHALGTQPLRLFDGNLFHPVSRTLLFSDPNVSSGLLTSPAYALGAPPAVLLNLLYLGSFVSCGVSAFLLVREWYGGRRAAIAAGLLFAFSSIRLGQFDHVQLMPFWWTPLSLLYLGRFLHGGERRPLVLMACAFALQVYTSIYLAALAASALVLQAILAVATGRSRRTIRELAIGALAAAGIVAILCSPLIACFLEVRRTWAPTRSLGENLLYSASPLAYLSAFPKSVFWGRALAGFRDPVAPWEKYLFPGIVPLVLAAYAFWRERDAWIVRYGLLLAAVSLVLSLGPHLLWRGEDTGWPLPYLVGYEWLPPLRALRVPARWGLLASLGLSLAAAAGASRLRGGISLLALVLALAEARIRPFPLGNAPAIDRAVDRFLAGAGDGPIVELPLGETSEVRDRLEPPRLYASTRHWRRLANGYSGYTPPSYQALAAITGTRPPEEVLPVLAAWNIRTVVLHLNQMTDDQRSRWSAPCAGAREVFSDRAIRVLEVRAPSEPYRPVRAELDAVGRLAAGRREAVIAVLRSEHPTALPPALFGWHRGRARWWSREGGSAELWAKYYCPPVIHEQMPVKPLFLQTPAAAGAYRLELKTSCFEVSTEIQIGPEERGDTRRASGR